MLKHNRRGASLVAIMIAIATIGIVVAMAVPAQTRNNHVRHTRICHQNLARIEGAIHALRQDEGPQAIENQRLALNDLIQTTRTGYLRTQPHCPANGAYTPLGNATAQCSIHGSIK